ncbi:MAG: DTW domain-containing protein [Bdellovibrio sp.]|nr:DTW domain-containing protein [Bdellovibrio sp.]
MDEFTEKTRKPKGKRKTQDPCEVCFLHKNLCICEFIPTLNLRSKLSLVVHVKELKRTTNTGTLATKALLNSEIFIRGKMNEPLDLTSQLTENYHHVLFYPSDGAIALDEAFVKQSSLPINLIVPDGNWRQASKVHYRHQELKNLPRVMIKTANSESHHLRAETTEFGMATLQAIAHAFGFMEGEAVKDELLKLYKLKLSRTLKGRGVVQI